MMDGKLTVRERVGDDIVSRLRGHAHRIVYESSQMRRGYGVATEAGDRYDLESLLDEAADEIERLRGEAEDLELEALAESARRDE